MNKGEIRNTLITRKQVGSHPSLPLQKDPLSSLLQEYKQLKSQVQKHMTRFRHIQYVCRAIKRAKSKFFSDIYIIEQNGINHILLHSEVLKGFRKFIEALDRVQLLFKQISRLKGSDMEFELIKNHEYFKQVYSTWTQMANKQLQLELDSLNLQSNLIFLIFLSCRSG